MTNQVASGLVETLLSQLQYGPLTLGEQLSVSWRVRRPRETAVTAIEALQRYCQVWL